MKLINYQHVLLITSILFFVQCAAVKKVKIAEKNKETVKLWFEEGWNNHRQEELLAQCFAEDWEDGNPLQGDQIGGLEGMRQSIANYQKAFKNGHFTITHLSADDQYVTVRYEVSSVQQGDMFGVESKGKSFQSTGMVLYEMENGKVKKSWHEVDMVGIINQLKN